MPVRALLLALLAVAATLAAAAGGDARPTQPAPARPLVTGITDGAEFGAVNPRTALARTKAAGASVVRLNVSWRSVAPAGRTKPNGFVATDPDDPAYRWAAVDRQVKAVVAAGLEPILTLYEAPEWAAPTRRERGQDGPTRPSPTAFADFATAAAKRYSGAGDLPRVRYWQAWNEPNVSIYLMPQYQGSRRISPYWYRRLINAFHDAVKRVHRDNVVVLGGLSPFTVKTASVETVGPLRFLRDLLCVSGGRNPRPTCGARVRFDVVAIHPYTSGDPTHEAANADDLSLGDLPELRPLLRAAVAAGHLVSAREPQIWVTEFSWDTSPPDPDGVPMALHARWTAEALYRMWDNGVSLVTWFTLRDQPVRTSDFQSGLYRRGRTLARDRAKPALTAFRFPFVAFQERGSIDVWGRTPTSDRGTVRVELKTGRRWVRLGTARADRNGIFRASFRSNATRGYVRAVLGNGAKAIPFSLRVPPDRYVEPF